MGGKVRGRKMRCKTMQERKGWRAGGDVCAEAQQVQAECGGGGDECNLPRGALLGEKMCKQGVQKAWE